MGNVATSLEARNKTLVRDHFEAWAPGNGSLKKKPRCVRSIGARGSEEMTSRMEADHLKPKAATGLQLRLQPYHTESGHRQRCWEDRDRGNRVPYFFPYSSACALAASSACPLAWNACPIAE